MELKVVANLSGKAQKLHESALKLIEKVSNVRHVDAYNAAQNEVSAANLMINVDINSASQLYINAVLMSHNYCDGALTRKIVKEALYVVKDKDIVHQLKKILSEVVNYNFKRLWRDVYYVIGKNNANFYAKKVSVFSLEEMLCSKAFLKLDLFCDSVVFIKCDKDGNIDFRGNDFEFRIVPVDSCKEISVNDEPLN